jgi:hypothetical protein
VAFRSISTRWPLRATDVIEIWSGTVLLGTISGEAIRVMIAHHLATTQVQAMLVADMAQTRDPDADVFPALPVPRKPLTPAVSWKKQEELRMARRRPKKRTRMLWLPLLLLAGCSSYSWSHPQLDQARYKRDHYECDRDSTTYGGGSGLAGALMIAAAQSRADRLYAMCMEARGYAKVPN